MASSPACLRRSLLACSRLHVRAPISTSARLQAGHNKWSKIRHDKGTADRRRGAQNILLAKAITYASKRGGPNKNDNPALAAAISAAKAANATNDFIERHIARGQQRTQSSALEKLTLEAVMPGNVALILEIETDSRLRSLQDLNVAIKKAGGKQGSTLFYFEHCGRIVVDAEGELGDEVVGAVIEEEGVLDFDVGEGEATVWTAAGETGRIAGVVRERCGVEARGLDLMWRARADMGSALDDEVIARDLATFLASLHEFPEVTASYVNAGRGAVSEEAWADVRDSLMTP